MRSVLFVLALAPACGFQVSGDATVGDDADAGNSGSDAGDGGGSATGSDAMVDPGTCFGTYHQICLAALPTGELRFKVSDNNGSNNFDTGSDSRCVATTSGGTGLCVMVGTSITVDGNAVVRAHDSAHPLVLIATTGDITISGTIDVSSHVGTNIGAGGNGIGGTETCNAGTAPSFAGGGQGGSFASIGGDGGDSAAAMFNAVGGTHGGLIPFPSGMLRGGCKGAGGAKVPTSVGVGGPGGNSGGAVLIIGTGNFTMGGVIDASGSGGQGGSAGANTMTDGFNRGGGGGGGGGSGGMIVIDAPMVMLGGRLWSEGGGGGEGGGTQVGGNGTSGTPGAMAPGGTGHDGGDGGAGSQGGGAGFVGTDGGQAAPGGGGGGGGFNYTTAANATIAAGSSPPVAHP